MFSSKRILSGIFFLSILFLIMGCSFATENISDSVDIAIPDNYEGICTQTLQSDSEEISPESNAEILEENNNIVNFTSDVTSGFESIEVQFNDTSNGDITSWYWDFGDGYNDTIQNATHKYEKFGSYNVSLTTFYNDGTYNTLIKPNYINVYTGSVFVNPDFEEGFLGNTKYGVYGWIDSDSAQIRKGVSGYNSAYSGTYFVRLFIPSYHQGGGKDPWYDYATFGQIVNFDVIDNITFYAKTYVKNQGAFDMLEGNQTFNVTIGDVIVGTYELDTWQTYKEYTIDTTSFNSAQLFKITFLGCLPATGTYSYYDAFTASYNGLTHADFTYTLDNIIDNNITLQFNSLSVGLITDLLWEFDDGTTSTELNPVHSFKSGSHTVKLTASNVNHTDTFSYDFDLDFPSINGQMYKTMQEAIDNATDGDVIDVPADLSENININKNLTLNFNGNKLIGSGSSPVIQVTGGAQATIKNITFENSNVISTDDESRLTITESNIANANITLNTGNIALGGNDFAGSFITVVNANAVISNNNITNGGVKVNGGKSKINNNVLSGNDVAIAQTEGETNITSNIIIDNNIGVNVTNGTANINFNVIYSNNKVSLAYVGSVDASNNWFGVFQSSFSTTPSDEYVDVYAPEAESQPAWLVLTLDCNETTLYSNQDYTICVDLTINSNDDNTSALGVLPKFNLPVSTKLGEASAVNVENSMGEFILTTGTLTSDETIFTIIDEDYTLDVDVFKIEDKINELEKQLAEAQANATKLADELKDANDKVGNLTTQLNETQVNASKLADELKDANDKVGNLTTQLNETQANATKLTEDLANANQKAENLTTQLGDAQKQIQTLSADLISTTVAANNLNIKALTNGNIQVTLKANNTALANKTVKVIINGIVKEGTTDENGVAKIAVKYSSAGTYYATVTFAGDDTYKSSISTSKVVVSKKATKITAPKKTFKAKTKTKKVKITLKSGSTVLKSKKITLKVNGKTYTAKTNSKGVATIKVTKLTKKGTFTYTVKFAGDKAYKAITKKGKMTIK